jgi:hypothetical protein
VTYQEVFVQQYGDVHRELREVLQSLPDEALNWVPYPGANPIAVLVTHLLGNELETIQTVKRLPTDRNRASEFEVKDAAGGDLLALVDDAESVLRHLAPQIAPEDLDRMVRRPAALSDTARTGLYQLAHSIAHAREHVGQIWLTRDLWNARS